MIELSKERIDQLLNEENVKKEEIQTILRSLYLRYMRLYERYFADIDALNDDYIAQLKNYHEETISLYKYYFLDIPQDTCESISKFDNEYSAKLLGADWHKHLFSAYEEFKNDGIYRNKDEAFLKKEFTKKALEAFYYEMDLVFREGFGTGGKTVSNIINGFTGLLFGKKSS